MDSEQNDNVAEGNELDETGAVEAAEYAGKDAAEDIANAKAFIKTLPDFPATIKKDVSGPVHPSKVEPVSETVVQGNKYAKELPITHLKNPVNNKVFAATPDLMKRRDLVPCDEDGKKVYDHRCL